MVAGCNLTFSPESYTWLNNLNFLSADGKCYSFDHRANGYSRGEGVAVMILKRVSDAVRDGNTIRAVIRSTLSNEDGRTPGITQPSSLAQERLIRETYERAGLSMVPTRYFEAHGTGTSVGDPCEVRAISSAFEDARSVSDPLLMYVFSRVVSMLEVPCTKRLNSGAVKSSIGHLEGASGLAGVIKAVLVLEKGIIPPNANFEKLNPKIDAQFGELQVCVIDGTTQHSTYPSSFANVLGHMPLCIVIITKHTSSSLKNVAFGPQRVCEEPPSIPSDTGAPIVILCLTMPTIIYSSGP